MKKEINFKLTSMKKAETFKVIENTEKYYVLESDYHQLTITKVNENGDLLNKHSGSKHSNLLIPKSVIIELKRLPLIYIQTSFF